MHHALYLFWRPLPPPNSSDRCGGEAELCRSGFKRPRYTESGLGKKGGGGGEQVDSGKADLAAQFPSVRQNVKPKPVSVGKNVSHKGAMQARLPALPHKHPPAEAK